jgi:hypothetical protein
VRGGCLFRAKSQREFQVLAAYNFRHLAKHFFTLEVPFQPVNAAEKDRARKVGPLLLELFWALWVTSIVFFLVGVVVAVCALR